MTPTSAPDARLPLRLLATSDVHVHLLNYDYYADRPADDMGLSLTATLIAQARQESRNSLLFDNGDFLQGNPLGDYIVHSGAMRAGHVHPAIRAMNRLGYDAATLGNHEFNYGLDQLLDSLQGAEFPVVSANVLRRLGATPEQDETLLPPHVLLERELRDDAGQIHRLKIAVIGFAPPQILQWDRMLLQGRIETRGILETAEALVPRLRAAGADLVVALSHSGIGAMDRDSWAENATTALATVPGIDAIIAGHSHRVFPAPTFEEIEGVDPLSGTIFGKPVVMPGFNGSHLGVIDLDLRQDAQGRWQVAGAKVAARAVQGAGIQPSAAVERAVCLEHDATVAFARRTVGETMIPLHSYFALVNPAAALRVVAEAQLRHVRKQLQGRPEAALPLLSAASPFKAGGRGGPRNFVDIPAGPMALRHVADLYIFPNTIAALRLTGAELADWLENSMGIYRQIQPGLADQPLIDPEFPSYNHDRILGLTFDIDLASPARYDRFGVLRDPAAQRVHNLRHNGQPLDPAAEFILATNSYRAAGCGGYTAARPDRIVDVGRAPIRDILLGFVRDTAPVALWQGGSFGFLPMPGTSVQFETGRDALPYLDEIAHFSPEPLCPTEDGFLSFRLHL